MDWNWVGPVEIVNVFNHGWNYTIKYLSGETKPVNVRQLAAFKEQKPAEASPKPSSSGSSTEQLPKVVSETDEILENQSRRVCFNCGRFGHFEKNCWAGTEESDN